MGSVVPDQPSHLRSQVETYISHSVIMLHNIHDVYLTITLTELYYCTSGDKGYISLCMSDVVPDQPAHLRSLIGTYTALIVIRLHTCTINDFY